MKFYVTRKQGWRSRVHMAASIVWIVVGVALMATLALSGDIQASLWAMAVLFAGVMVGAGIDRLALEELEEPADTPENRRLYRATWAATLSQILVGVALVFALWAWVMNRMWPDDVSGYAYLPPLLYVVAAGITFARGWRLGGSKALRSSITTLWDERAARRYARAHTASGVGFIVAGLLMMPAARQPCFLFAAVLLLVCGAVGLIAAHRGLRSRLPQSANDENQDRGAPAV